MDLESMMLYSCSVCGNTMCGMEWEDSPSVDPTGKDYKCPSCGYDLDAEQLLSEED